MMIKKFCYCFAIGLFLFAEYGLSVELRCYCNLPDCVHTAYMCKSDVGCFQELPYGRNSKNRSPRIGCLELWSRKRPFHCVSLKSIQDEISPFSTTTTTTTVRPEHEKGRRRKKSSFLRCCLEDMCNYVPQFEPELNISVLKTEQEVSISVKEGSTYSKKPWLGENGAENISERIWFRAAVIAVPICGGIILLILIFMACTLLRSDWRKVSDNDWLLPPGGVAVENERCTSATPAFQEIQPNCQKLLYSPPFPSYLRGQLRHYHSDTTLVCCNEKTKDRPYTAFFPGA